MEVFSRFEFLEDAAALFLVRFPVGGWGSVGHANSGRHRAMLRWYPWDRSEAVLVWNKTRCFPKTWHPRNSQKIPRQDVFFFKTSLTKTRRKRKWMEEPYLQITWVRVRCYLQHCNSFIHVHHIRKHIYIQYLHGRHTHGILHKSSELVLFWTSSVWNTLGNRNKNHGTSYHHYLWTRKNLSKMKGFKVKKWVKVIYNL